MLTPQQSAAVDAWAGRTAADADLATVVKQALAEADTVNAGLRSTIDSRDGEIRSLKSLRDDLQQKVNDLTTSADALTAEVARLRGVIAGDAHQGIIDALQVQLTDMTAQRDELQRVIDNWPGGEEPPLPPSPPPPTAQRAMWLGAALTKRNNETDAQAVTNWEGSHGRLGAIRVFCQNFPANYAACNFASQMHGRHRVVSVKPGNTSPTAKMWDDLIASWPKEKVSGTDDPAITVFVENHEPENDGGVLTPAVFKARCDLMDERIAASGRDDIVSGVVYMTWLERDGVASTTTKDWFPSNLSRFVMLLDPYDPNGNKSLKDQALATLTLWRAEGGVFWGIAETGSHRIGTALVAWINESLAWALSEGALFFQWFHSDVGADAIKKVGTVQYNGWWLDDPAGAAAFKAKAPVMFAAA